MKYSFVLPVRNGGAHLKECVASVLAQSCAGFHLHILDNCSTDGSLEWIQQLADDRIILHTSERPLSIEESWRRTVSIPKNEFVTFTGHDDLFHPHYLATMEALIAMHPGASLYQTQFNLIDENGKIIRRCQAMPERETSKEFLHAVLHRKVDVYGTGYMMHSKDYDTVGGIPAYPNLLFADFELWLNLTRNSYKATSPEVCFSYRLHQSTTKISSNVKMLDAFGHFVDYLITLKNDVALRAVIEKESAAFLRFYCRSLSHRLLKTATVQRGGLTVKEVVNKFTGFAEKLSVQKTFHPEKEQGLRAALFIDRYPLLRRLFLSFKKLYAKPVLK